MEVFVFAFLLPEFYLFCVHYRVTDSLMTSKSESFLCRLRSANDGACLIEKIQRKWLLNFVTLEYYTVRVVCIDYDLTCSPRDFLVLLILKI